MHELRSYQVSCWKIFHKVLQIWCILRFQIQNFLVKCALRNCFARKHKFLSECCLLNCTMMNFSQQLKFFSHCEKEWTYCHVIQKICFGMRVSFESLNGVRLRYSPVWLSLCSCLLSSYLSFLSSLFEQRIVPLCVPIFITNSRSCLSIGYNRKLKCLSYTLCDEWSFKIVSDLTPCCDLFYSFERSLFLATEEH